MIGRSPTARRATARLHRAVVVAALTVPALLVAPGTASAAGQVSPVLNCTQPGPGGGFTAVIGYDNSSAEDVTIPYGKGNWMAPTKYDGAQPTVFRAGRHDGAFTVTVTDSGAHWTLGEAQLWIRPSADTACPASTELPEEGNGTGPAVALVAAGLIGAAMVHRARARALAATGRSDA